MLVYAWYMSLREPIFPTRFQSYMSLWSTGLPGGIVLYKLSEVLLDCNPHHQVGGKK